MRFETALYLSLPLLSQVYANPFPQNNGGNGANNGDPQQSLTLDPKVIANFSDDGQQPPTAGQAPSLTSTNNFINFCLTVPNLPLTNGQQIRTGSCNPAPMGLIPSFDKMPSVKISNPKNGDTVPANQAFDLQVAVQNLNTGNFVNPSSKYYAAPQQLQGDVITGHCHVVCQALTSPDQTTPLDTRNFTFFKGLNDAAQNGILTTTVTDGLPPGDFRCCTMVGAANHQPPLVAVAQRGTVDDCIYMQAVGNGAATNSTAATPPTVSADPAATGNGGNSTAVDPSSTSSTPPAAGSDAANNGGNSTSAGNNAVVNAAKGGKKGNKKGNKNGNKKGNKKAGNVAAVKASAAPAASSPANGGNKGGNGGKGANRLVVPAPNKAADPKADCTDKPK